MTTYNPGVQPMSLWLDQLLYGLENLAMSSAMQAEIAAYQAWINSRDPLTFNVRDVNGNLVAISTSPQFAPSWSVAPEFNKAWISTGEQITSDNIPGLELIGRPGRPLQGEGGAVAFEAPDIEGYRAITYLVDAYAWAASSDLPNLNVFEAMVLAECFARLVKRNYTLGGLVMFVNVPGPVIAIDVPPGASTEAQAACCGVRFEITALVP